jgi:UDP-2,3-diacylglucosamine hydrolase
VANTLFISDLHLDPARPAVTRALAEFLSRSRDCHSLYILGDLFEAWLGDDDHAPLSTRVSSMLHQFSAAGPSLYIMVGNRDFLLGRDFCEAAGATLLSDPTVIDLYGEPTLLMHGDSLCTSDVAYQAFRREARSPDWQRDVLSRPLAERRELARSLRAMSAQANSIKSEDIMDVTPQEVTSVMAQHGVRQLIHGHTHRPARHALDAGLRWVLGAWEDQGWFIEATPREIKLNIFDINQ